MAKDHSLRRATKVTLSASTQSFNDKVGKKDLTDLYRFSLSQSSSLDLKLENLSNNADVELYQRNLSAPKKAFNKIKKVEFSQLFKKPFKKALKLERQYSQDFKKSLTRLAISKKRGKKNEQISRELAAGEYYIRIRPTKASSKKNRIRYTLNLSAPEFGNEVSTPPVTSQTVNEPANTSTPSATPLPSTTSTPSVPAPAIIPDGNQTPETALGLTLNEQYKTYTNSDLSALPTGADAFGIGDSDREDYYQITLANRTFIDLSIGGLTADIDAQLLDQNQQPIRTSDNGGTTGERITESLDAGTYFLRVYQPTEGTETNYTLSGNGLPLDDNNSPERADSLGFLSFQSTSFNNNNTAFSDRPFSIDENDTVDYFTFDLQWDSEIRFNLSGLTADLEMSIVNSTDTETLLTPEIASAGSGNEAIAPSATFNPTLDAGQYLLKIEPKTPGVISKDYTLDLAAVPLQTDSFETGDSPAEARDFPLSIGDLGNQTSFSNSLRFGDDELLWVGGADPDDYYKLTLDEKSYISIDLIDLQQESASINNRPNNLDVQLLRQTSASPVETEIVVTSARPGDLAEVVGGQLDAGTYYIRVSPSTEADGAFYQMDLALFSLNDVPFLTKDIYEGTRDGVRSDDMVSIGTDVYFVATDDTGTAIWISSGASEDASEETTRKVIQSFNDNGQEKTFDAIESLSTINNQLYFLGTVDGQQSLWTEGASGLEQLTTNLLFDVTPPNFTVVDNDLYFIAYTDYDDGSAMTGAKGFELWSVTGSTVSLKTNFDPDDQYEFRTANDLTVVDGVFYFRDDSQLYRYDPTTATAITSAATTNVTPLLGTNPSGSPRNLTAVGDTLYFTLGGDLRSVQNGDTTVETTAVAVGSDAISRFGEEFLNVTVAGEQTLYFTARSSIGGIPQTELWYLNASQEAERVTNLAGTGSPDPTELTVIGDTLYFAARDENADEELWTVNINPNDLSFHQPSLVKDINAVETSEGSGVTRSSTPRNFIAVDGTLYFSADNGVNGKELWKSDGTAEGTQLVYNIQLPIEVLSTEEIDGQEVTVSTKVDGSSEPDHFINVGNRLFFTAVGTLADAASADGRQKLGRELWALGLKEQE